MTTESPTPKLTPPNAIDPGNMRFYDNFIPTLQPGNYEISVTQRLLASAANSDGHDVDYSAAKSQQFVVQRPRFSLDPQEIQRQFPPPNSSGVFGDALPQIVMRHRGLPWERSPFLAVDGSGEPDKSTPWLALIVLHSSELLAPSIGSNASDNAASENATSADNPLGVTTVSLSELLQPAESTLLPAIELQEYEDPASKCQVIEITADSFNRLLPKQVDLPYLSTVRQVNLIDKSVDGLDAFPEALQEASIPDWQRWFSVVSAHRFPEVPRGNEPLTNIVHLVSLEGFQDYLKTESASDLPAGTQRVRMVSMASWQFSSLRETGKSFEQLMQGVLPTANGGADDVEQLMLRMPFNAAVTDNDAADYASAALTAGYVPKHYASRQGEQTFAWYRGPFTPAMPQALPRDTQFISSAQAAAYDADRGLFDLSYAVAFETGRAKALASPSFTAALCRWQNSGHRLLEQLVERAAQAGANDMASLTAEQVSEFASGKLAVAAALKLVSAELMAVMQEATANGQGETPVVAELSEAISNDISSLKAALDNQEVQALLRQRGADTLQTIAEFLSRLWLLEGLPFNTLIADAQMLPRESLRFFYVDRNWQRAMIQGAMSTGISSSKDEAYQQLMLDDLMLAVEQAAISRRSARLGVAADALPARLPTGMLLRSAAVSGWPSLQVRAFRGSEAGQRKRPIPLLRMERVSASVLLCLFADIPDWVEIDEPREGLHFGVESSDKVFLRHLDGEQVGELIETADGDNVSIVASIDPDSRILDIADTRDRLCAALNCSELSPAQWSLQMIAAPENLILRSPAKG